LGAAGRPRLALLEAPDVGVHHAAVLAGKHRD
jgi:hypothetical protein